MQSNSSNLSPATSNSRKIEEIQLDWLKSTYQGDHMPQLTIRAVLTGGILGSIMSVSNLYTTLKLGWAFGVAITACVLSFTIWKLIRIIAPKLPEMTLLENNCMQSTASAAGYSTGATIGTAFGAYLLITGYHIEWRLLLCWSLVTAALGVFLAVPMKRQMINYEQLPFPSGIAAAETLRSLYSRSREALVQAYCLVVSLIAGALIGILSKGEFVWQKILHVKLPELIPFYLQIRHISISSFPNFGFEPSVLLVGAGMIVGARVSISMLLGSLILYLVVGPIALQTGEIQDPAKLLKWSLWSGTALMVASGLTAFALQWKTLGRAVLSIKRRNTGVNHSDLTNMKDFETLNKIEVPVKWFLVGTIPLAVAMIWLQYLAFSIALPLGILSVLMSFLLALVACRATGETDITPVGPMGKITQLVYAVLAPSNITANLMSASVTANVATSSADLLTDLKSGYLLGANARKQFLAQFIGIFFGAAAIVPAWYLMVPNKAALEAFNPPAANMWKAVAEALSYGIEYVPVSARWGIMISGLLGIVLALSDHFFPKAKRFLPSAMGLGLSWVVPFANCLSFFLGTVIVWAWSRLSARTAQGFIIPVASGAIAGESLACAVLAIVNACTALGKH